MKNIFKRFSPVTLAVVLCFSTMLIYFMSYMDIENIQYPLTEDISTYDPYVQQFDAFMKGQLHIDCEPSEELLALDNPYNPDERGELEFLWDRALFNGKYYSYFGIAPIITVMLPFYLISGMLPSALLVQFVYIGIFSIVFPKLLMLIMDRYSKKVHWGFKVLLTYVAYLTSFNLLYGRGNNPFYYIACTAAIAFLTLFAYMFFKGIFEEEHKKRCIYFVFAGLMYALCIHSRINVAFMAVFFVVPPIIFKVILEKQKIKAKLIQLACLGSFVLVGLVGALVYNQARFDSPFEFGTTYQLTVADVSEYELKISEFDDAIKYYYESTFITSDEHGRNVLKNTDKKTVDRYIYIEEYFGLYTVPYLMAGFLIIFMLFNKKINKGYKITLLSTLAGGFIVAWIDFCLGGVIFRYLADISTEAAVCAVLGTLYLLELSYGIQNKKIANLLRVAIVGIVVISLFDIWQIMTVHSINLFDFRDNSIIGRFI